jgi:hypothetical protein
MRLPLLGEASDADAGDEVQSRAELAIDSWEADAELDWQPELDSALDAIDSILPVKRRRATDPPGTPPFPRPELGAVGFTPEMLDALTARVAEKLRTARERTAAVAEPPPMKEGAIVSIRFRWPLFSLGFGRRRRRARAQA